MGKPPGFAGARCSSRSTFTASSCPPGHRWPCSVPAANSIVRPGPALLSSNISWSSPALAFLLAHQSRGQAPACRTVAQFLQMEYTCFASGTQAGHAPWCPGYCPPLHSAVRLPGAQHRAMRSPLRLEVRSWGCLPAPEWTHSCPSSGLPVSFPSLPIPRSMRFRVNGSHDAVLGGRSLKPTSLFATVAMQVLWPHVP